MLFFNGRRHPTGTAQTVLHARLPSDSRRVQLDLALLHPRRRWQVQILTSQKLLIRHCREPLPDALFSLLPETSWALEVGDLMVTLCALSAIVVCFLHRYRFVVLRRLLFIAAVLYTLRSLTLLATQLPSGYSDNETRCRERLNGTDRTLKVYFLRTIEQTIHIGFQVCYLWPFARVHRLALGHRSKDAVR